jgi:hypothetical protein
MANPFAILAEEQPIERPNTPTNSSTAPPTPLNPILTSQANGDLPVTLEKKKAKRKATSPMPAITPIRLAKPSPKLGTNRTATGYLYLARKALHAALKAEKQDLGEGYTEDNGI